MKVNGQDCRTIRLKEGNQKIVEIIDQRWLPHQFVIAELADTEEVATAIEEMWVRGAPLIGATGAFGIYIAVMEALAKSDGFLYINAVAHKLLKTRPTAVNLKWAITQQLEALEGVNDPEERVKVALRKAQQIADDDVELCYRIGQHGLDIIRKLSKEKNGQTVNVLTHCNAGWVACIDWGTATAPIYQAHEEGISIHVWVDETRPRNQGARITAWELDMQGVPYTVITDNTGGHLMQHGQVDLCLVGSDRTTRTGDVANKIGTYLKALAAYDNKVPFYVALPSTTIDWSLTDGLKEIPIEERAPEEVLYIQGLIDGEIKRVLVPPASSTAKNYGFDVTPARLITGIITERGLCEANEASLSALFPEKQVK